MGGAFRFETACRRGFYLAYLPSTDLRVVSFLTEEPGRVLDFMLVDFSAMVSFKDLDEVLTPIAEPNRGSWLPLDKFLGAAEVKTYFQKVLKKPVWDVEDFAAYFEGHFSDWEYNPEARLVRLRSLDERLGHVLQTAASVVDASIAVLSAKDELGNLPLHGVLRAINLLTTDGESDGMHVERLKLLRALPDALLAAHKQEDVPPPPQLLEAAEKIPRLCPAKTTPDILEHRKVAVRSLVDLAVNSFSRLHSSNRALHLDDLLRMLRLPGAANHADELSKVFGDLLAKTGRCELVQVVQRAATASCPNIAEAAAAACLASLDSAQPDEAGEAVASLARAGAQTDRLAETLLRHCGSMSTAALGPALLALADRGVGNNASRLASENLARRDEVSKLPKETLLGLAVASNRSASLAPLLETVATAVVSGIRTWSMVDVAKFLLSIVRQKQHLLPATQDALLCAVGEAAVSQLGDASAADFVKVILAASGFGPSPLLESCAKEAVVRLPDLSFAHLVLVTQGLAQSLEPDHPALKQVLDFWAQKLPLRAPAAKRKSPGDMDRILIGSEGIPIELLLKLVFASSAALKSDGLVAGVRERFAKSVGQQLFAQVKEVPEGSYASVRSEFNAGGCLHSSPHRSELLAALRKMERAPQRGIEAAVVEDTRPQGRRKKKRRRS